MEDYFAKDFSSLRNQVISRYPSFFQKLLLSPSREVRLLAHIVSRDPESVTEGERWRLGLLENYLSVRRQLERDCEDTLEINGLIDSLCVN